MIRALPAMLLMAAVPPAAIAANVTLIRGAHVFDGTGSAAAVGDVLIRGDRIVAVAPRLAAPAGARIVRARGLTLLPGLHDLHTHMRSPAFAAPEDAGKAYAGHLLNGVTTANDFSVSSEMIAPIRAMTRSGMVPAPHLRLAVRLGVPGGHGTEYGWGSAFTLPAATPRAAHVAMRTALGYRPDVIKVFADGWRYGRNPDLNDMDLPTLTAVVQDAHAAGIPVLTHTVTLAGAKVAAAAGVDAIGHGIGDAPVDAALIALMHAHRTAYVPTLVVYEPQEDRQFDPREWAGLRPGERAREAARLTTPPAVVPAEDARRWAIMQDNVRRLKAAGVRIGIGTDAGIEGVYHGTSAVREIMLLTRLGFTPAEALAAGTAGSAAIAGQAVDHGRIAAGQRADLLLTGGRPDRDIADLRDVRRVFVAGAELSLPRLRAALHSPVPTPLPRRSMPGPIDTGVRADGRTDLDTWPVESTDPGIDHSHLDIVRPNDGTDRRLFLVARLGAAPRPFAQLIVPLTPGGVELADARGFAGIAVTVRGDGRYRLTLESYGIDPENSFAVAFAAGSAAREIRLPFAAFASSDPTARLDLASLRTLAFRLAGPPGGHAWLELANLRFYR